MRVSWNWIAGLTFFFLAGCGTISVPADPKAIGLPTEAQNWGVGSLSNGAMLTLGGSATQPGTFIVVAGDQPILEQAVLANDRVWVDIDHPLLGDPFHCQIQVKVNGAITRHASATPNTYHAYFVPGRQRMSGLESQILWY